MPDPQNAPAPVQPMPANPAEPMLRYFEFGHLPKQLQDVSKLFQGCAVALIATLPRSAERTVALRKLLEAKDCAVRAAVYDNRIGGAG